jgi:concentrative nucleoside transporter, CNT family
MERFTGLIGIVVILVLAYSMSSNRKAINIRLVVSGLLLQFGLALFVLKTPIGQAIFQSVGAGISHLLEFSGKGAEFVFGLLTQKEVLDKVFGAGSSFIFAIQVVPTIILVAVLVNIFYHLGIMQRVVSLIARGIYAVLPVSGAEALSNVSSAFVGQVEAQLMIKPYLVNMTKSEILASMAGSFACISGGVMAVYISLGVPAPYLLAASIMAAPGALVIAKIVMPETEESQTKGAVTIEVKQQYANLTDAISHGAGDGLKVSLNVIAMLIGFIALIAVLDAMLGGVGYYVHTWTGWMPFGFDFRTLSMRTVLGGFFSMFALVMGVPFHEIQQVGALLGTKIVVNEFVAYTDMSKLLAVNGLSPKAVVIASFALCGFANFSSVGIQVGGIGEIAPSRRAEISQLAFKALICGTLASYLSATIAGILM